ncbi:MAG: ABC transporter permease, partial [Thermomicrobiales bacterium]|nr:ABC transporter permease [Thermomicrobiales bacterium]
ACSITIALLSVEFGWSIWAAILASFVLAMALGVFNGVLVLRTGLPSFIVTLGTLFMVRGATIGITRSVTGRTQVGGVGNVPGIEGAQKLFASAIPIGGANFAISIVWWVLVVALGSYLLLRTRFGNWIFGVGGSFQAARNVGVPVTLVKIALFMLTAGSAWLVSTIQVVTFSGADVLRGQYREFYAIIAAVIGGNLLTGGYGSVVGAAFGALIVGMIQQGVVFAGVDADWVQFFLGAMLLAAVLVNRAIRFRVTGGRE